MNQTIATESAPATVATVAAVPPSAPTLTSPTEVTPAKGKKGRPSKGGARAAATPAPVATAEPGPARSLILAMINPAKVKVVEDRDIGRNIESGKEGSWVDFAADIKRNGVRQSVLVRPIDSNKLDEASFDYVVIAGRRRTLAAQDGGLAMIPALIKTDDTSDQGDAWRENESRKTLSGVEKVKLIQAMMSGGFDGAAIHKEIGGSPSGCDNLVRCATNLFPSVLAYKNAKGEGPTLQKLIKAAAQKTEEAQLAIVAGTHESDDAPASCSGGGSEGASEAEAEDTKDADLLRIETAASRVKVAYSALATGERLFKAILARADRGKSAAALAEAASFAEAIADILG